MADQKTEKDPKRCSCGSLVVERELIPGVLLRSHVGPHYSGRPCPSIPSVKEGDQ